MSEDNCPTCGRPHLEILSADEIATRLQALESRAVEALEDNLNSMDERIRQAAAKLLLEFSRGKPKQSVEQKTEVTTVVYESAAWMPDTPPLEITSGGSA